MQLPFIRTVTARYLIEKLKDPKSISGRRRVSG